MNENGTLDDRYLEWLYEQIGAVRNRNPARSYWELANQLYRKPFHWTVPNDDNRAADGVDLRYEFIDAWDIKDATDEWLSLDCSMLEMLIALSRRVSFEDEGTAGGWFWRFIENLDIHNYTDAKYNRQAFEEVDEALGRVIHRSYQPNGLGGLFPLRRTNDDQRRVELWYQMSTYLLEGNHLGDGA